MKRENTTQKGRIAEDHAASWLEAHGLKVIDRNWRHNHLELDIIAFGPRLSPQGRVLDGHQDFIHVIEVRSRAENSPVSPQQTIMKNKQKFLVNAADAYVRLNGYHEEVIFDVIGIETRESGYVLTFTPDAFHPQW